MMNQQFSVFTCSHICRWVSETMMHLNSPAYLVYFHMRHLQLYIMFIFLYFFYTVCGSASQNVSDTAQDICQKREFCILVDLLFCVLTVQNSRCLLWACGPSIVIWY